MLWHWSSMNLTPTPGVAAAAHDLVQDAEQLERIGGTDDEVVVRVEARVEVERAEPAEPQQLHDDELDVRAGRVVAGVEDDDRPLPQRHALQYDVPQSGTSVA